MEECMFGRMRPLLIAVVCVLAVASGVSGADTGSISGTVFDASGAVVEGATVRVTGEALPGDRTASTGDNGTYKIDYLLPGAYEVLVEKPAVGTFKRAAIVEIGKDTQIEAVVGLAVSEEITVTAVVPVVDVRSTEVAFNFKGDALDGLPIERNYRWLFQHS